MIDANANRASEGLRVLEDIARFALDDAALSERAKRARHDLRAAVAALPIPSGLLVSVRDTPGDVGSTISTPAEGERIGLGAVAGAAGARAAEALRAIEEVAKTLGGDGSRFEKIRYEAYELDRLVRRGLIPASPQWALCVLISSDLCGGRGWESVAESAIAGGADCIQMREKALNDRLLLKHAERLVQIRDACAQGDGAVLSERVSIVINDRPDIALLAGADAVHVGQGDLAPRDIRAVAGAGMPVGVSTSTLDEALQAAGDGASSVGLGPMHATTTKRKDRIAGEAYLRAFLSDERVHHLPHLCIGGINTENAAALIGAGARGLAVSSAVCGADDPERTTRALRAIVDARGDGDSAV